MLVCNGDNLQIDMKLNMQVIKRYLPIILLALITITTLLLAKNHHAGGSWDNTNPNSIINQITAPITLALEKPAHNPDQRIADNPKDNSSPAENPSPSSIKNPPLSTNNISYMKMNGKFYYRNKNDKLIGVDKLEDIPLEFRKEADPNDQKSKSNYLQNLDEMNKNLESHARNLRRDNKRLKKHRANQGKKIERQIQAQKHQDQMKERARKLEKKKENDRWKLNYERSSRCSRRRAPQANTD